MLLLPVTFCVYNTRLLQQGRSSKYGVAIQLQRLRARPPHLEMIACNPRLLCSALSAGVLAVQESKHARVE